MGKLDRLYEAEQKARKEAGVKEQGDLITRKTYFAKLERFKVVPGFNIRDIDQEHVDNLCRALMENNEEFPALDAAIMDDGTIEIVDGHHRYYAALKAQSMGHPIMRLELKEFTGSSNDRVCHAVKSTNRRGLTSAERAKAYMRLRKGGWLDAEIASSVGRSDGDVRNHLLLAECGELVLGMVQRGELASSAVFKLARQMAPEKVYDYITAKTGGDAQQEPEPEQVGEDNANTGETQQAEPGTQTQAKPAKKPKKVKTDALVFTRKNAVTVTELATSIEWVGGQLEAGASVTLRMPADKYEQLAALLAKYMETA